MSTYLLVSYTKMFLSITFLYEMMYTYFILLSILMCIITTYINHHDLDIKNSCIDLLIKNM